jgi:hypothetical protein
MIAAESLFDGRLVPAVVSGIDLRFSGTEAAC